MFSLLPWEEGCAKPLALHCHPRGTALPSRWHCSAIPEAQLCYTRGIVVHSHRILSVNL